MLIKFVYFITDLHHLYHAIMVFLNYLLAVNLIHWIVKQVQEGKLIF